jgi:hypothetical protein
VLRSSLRDLEIAADSAGQPFPKYFAVEKLCLILELAPRILGFPQTLFPPN